MDVSGWRRTKEVLFELEELLLCGICKKLASEPCSLGKCEHFFCQSCVSDIKDNICPVCHVPSYVKDLQRNRQLATASTLCQELSSLLAKHDSSAVRTDTSNLATGHQMSPVSRRTRTNIKMKQKRTFLNNCNKSWRIGQAPGDSCHSCTKSKGRVLFKEESSHSMITKDYESLKCYDTMVSCLKQCHVETKASDNIGNDRDVTESNKFIEKQTSNDTNSEDHSTNKTINRKDPYSADHSTTDSKNLHKDYLDGDLQIQKKESQPHEGTTTPNVSKLKRPTQGSVSASPQSWISCQSTPTSNRCSPVCCITPQSIHKRNAKGETQLHVACIKGDVARVKQLLAAGAAVNTKDNAGWTPLHETCNHGNRVLTEILLDAGCAINTPGGPEGDTPLHDAVINGHVDCVRLLVSRGASVSQRNLAGKCPMDLASSDEMRKALQTPLTPISVPQTPEQLFAEVHTQQVVILTTGLTREQKVQIEKCCHLLHGKVAAEFTSSVTHVVTAVNKDGMCPRTLKYLRALVTGKWIVNVLWVETSFEYKRWVPEEAFVVPGASTSPNSMAPSKARQNHIQQLPPLFAGCSFYLLGDFKYPAPSRADLTDLIRDGGGVILNRQPRPLILSQSEATVPYHCTPGSRLEKCSHFIIQDKPKCSELISPRLALTTPAWLMDCIAYFKIIDLPNCQNS